MGCQQVVPQADRVLVRLGELPDVSRIGGFCVNCLTQALLSHAAVFIPLLLWFQPVLINVHDHKKTVVREIEGLLPSWKSICRKALVECCYQNQLQNLRIIL